MYASRHVINFSTSIGGVTNRNASHAFFICASCSASVTMVPSSATVRNGPPQMLPQMSPGHEVSLPAFVSVRVCFSAPFAFASLESGESGSDFNPSIASECDSVSWP